MGRLNVPTSNFADCLTIGEAAEFLGVSTATLRNWDRSGKLKPRRHPQKARKGEVRPAPSETRHP